MVNLLGVLNAIDLSDKMGIILTIVLNVKTPKDLKQREIGGIKITRLFENS